MRVGGGPDADQPASIDDNQDSRGMGVVGLGISLFGCLRSSLWDPDTSRRSFDWSQKKSPYIYLLILTSRDLGG